MQTLARLFGRSPFSPLQSHMAKVASCVHEMPALFNALAKKEYELVEEIASKMSKLEHDADLTKNDIRNNLPPGLLLPIARASLLEILSLQDNIADRAEDVAVLLTFINLEIPVHFQPELFSFLNKNLEAFEGVFRIIKEMGQLLESSFGGSEADKVRKMVDEVAFREHESDLLQRVLMKKVFSDSDQMSSSHFFLWMRVIQEVASISDESEKLANRICMLLEVR